MMTYIKITKKHLAVLITVLVASLWVLIAPLSAQEGSPLHPAITLLDAEGNNVLETGNPVSTIQTCGTCHNTTFIAEHNAHADVLTGTLNAPAGEGVFIDPRTGDLHVLEGALDSIEMNCFLCHTVAPNNAARLDALMSGNYAWANTATLLGSGIIEQTGDGFVWSEEAFAEDGSLLDSVIGIQDPSVENCGQCHGTATTDAITPLTLDTCEADQRTTLTTGQVFSPQRILDSGLNIADKDVLDRTWDVHAERVVGCTDCHHALNNPAYVPDTGQGQPEHLVFDPRRLDPGEYLERPVHEFARSEFDVVTDESCAACHEAVSTHKWLPYADQHMQEVACQTCHIPRQEAPANQSIDWTVLMANHSPVYTCRGETDIDQAGQSLITGYDPVLLNSEDTSKITPYNLSSTWYWADRDDQPVSLSDLQAAYFENDAYHPDVIAAFDADGDYHLSSDELFIDTDQKEQVIATRLAGLGIDEPHIVAEVEAYPIHHGVTNSEWATRDCRVCHGEDSRLVTPILLADNTPGSVSPNVDDHLPFAEGQVYTDQDTGAVYFQPATGTTGSGRYIFGFSGSKIIDWFGIIIFLGTLIGVTGHGGLRYLSARRNKPHDPELQEVYMYSIYERLWHWLQTAVILILIFTGLIIHKPDMFGIFSFAYVVQVHNIMAAILVINAGLALFYHLASGEIRQFLPEPHGFFNQAIVQAKFYIQGIFKGAEHPFEKTPERKMNPLQQVTYLGLLNVLMPLQIITGALMWGAQRWPDAAAVVDGLPVLAPFHTLVAWLFGSFVVAHVYLTTTGHEPLAGIKGMIMGWDEVEVHAGAD